MFCDREHCNYLIGQDNGYSETALLSPHAPTPSRRQTQSQAEKFRLYRVLILRGFARAIC